MEGLKTPSWQCHHWIREHQSLEDMQVAWMTHIPASPPPTAWSHSQPGPGQKSLSCLEGGGRALGFSHPGESLGT